MATRKFRKSKPRKTARRHRHSTAGKIYPLLDVRSNQDLKLFKQIIQNGELTMFVAWAKWCPHCHTFMPHLEAAAKSPNRSIQAVKVEEQMLPAVNKVLTTEINKSAKPLNVEGYPSIILIDKKGNKVTDMEPIRNTETMTKVMENAGPLAAAAGINKTGNNSAAGQNLKNSLKNINSAPSINKNNAANTANMIGNIPSLNKPNNMNKNVNKNNKNNNKNKKANLLANIGVTNEGLVSGVEGSTMKNIDIGEDELKGSIASLNAPKNNIKLNSVPVNNLSNTGNNVKTVKESLAESTAPSPINTTPSISGNNSNNSKKIVPPAASIKQMSQEAEEATSLVAPLSPPSITGDLDQTEDMESISNSLTPEQKVSGGARRGGSLYSAMARTTYTLAPAAALLATAAMVMKGKHRKSRKHSKKSRRTHRRRR